MLYINLQILVLARLAAANAPCLAKAHSQPSHGLAACSSLPNSKCVTAPALHACIEWQSNSRETFYHLARREDGFVDPKKDAHLKGACSMQHAAFSHLSVAWVCAPSPQGPHSQTLSPGNLLNLKPQNTWQSRALRIWRDRLASTCSRRSNWT